MQRCWWEGEIPLFLFLSLSLSLVWACGPRALSSGPFSLFRAQADFCSNAPKQRRFTEAIRNRLGGLFFQGLRSWLSALSGGCIKPTLVLEEGIIDWNRSPHRSRFAPSIPSFHLYCYSPREFVVVVDPFPKDAARLEFTSSDLFYDACNMRCNRWKNNNTSTD